MLADWRRHRGGELSERANIADATVHVVPAALPASSMSKMATMAKMASATHVVLMATSVVADIFMLHDDDGVGSMRVVCDAVRTSVTLRYTPLIDRGTQHHPLSAAVNKRRSPERPCGTGRVLQSCVAAAEQDSAADG